jgi:hypothetical protein
MIVQNLQRPAPHRNSLGCTVAVQLLAHAFVTIRLMQCKFSPVNVKAGLFFLNLREQIGAAAACRCNRASYRLIRSWTKALRSGSCQTLVRVFDPDTKISDV